MLYTYVFDSDYLIKAQGNGAAQLDIRGRGLTEW
jgi:hypothetical protein